MISEITLNNIAGYRRMVDTRPTCQLLSTYFLAACLVFFAVRGSFSFEYVDINTQISGAGSLVGAGSGEGSAVHSVELLMVYGCIVLFALRKQRAVLNACRTYYPILLLPAYAILSAAWSQEPMRSFVFGIFALLNTIFGIYVASCLSKDRQIRLFAFTGVVCAFASLLVIAAMPSAGIDHKTGVEAWQGIYPHKNICALVMLFLLPAPFLISPPRRPSRLAKGIYGLLSLGLIIMTQSRTGWLCGAGLIGLWAMFLVMKRFCRAERQLFVVALIFGIAMTSWLAMTYLPDVLVLLGKSADLTGRTGIWTAIMPALWKQPITGFGYSAFWIGFKGEAANVALASGYIGLNNAENGVLQMWLELGMIGVALLGFLLFQSLRAAVKVYRANQSGHYYWCAGIIFLTVLSLINGDKFMFPHSIEWTIFVVAYTSLRMQRRELLSVRRERQTLLAAYGKDERQGVVDPAFAIG